MVLSPSADSVWGTGSDELQAARLPSSATPATVAHTLLRMPIAPNPRG